MHLRRACLQEERVTLGSGLKLALVYKHISQVGLPYHWRKDVQGRRVIPSRAFTRQVG